MHVRQVALVARDLEPVVADLRAVLGLEVAFRDPGVAAFGLHNAVLPVGTTFLEVVSPNAAETTAERYLDAHGGDGGYMVILQTADLDADRRRLALRGVRIVWEITLDDIATVHLHPRDVGGAIISLDQPRPATAWRWAGPEWQAKARTDVVRAITGVTIAARDPQGVAARWSAVLGLPAPAPRGDALVLALDPGELRFVPGNDDRVVGVRLAAVDVGRALAAAGARGLQTGADTVAIGGVRFELT
jgi:catechol 2,3-dioxygenase-like lactoylglutathione lyase family enzyme